jgi:hypothetical protein
MTPEETFGQLLGLVKAWRVAEAGNGAGVSAVMLKVEAMPDLWPEASARAGNPAPLLCRRETYPAVSIIFRN